MFNQTEYILATVLGVLHALLVRYVYVVVPEPYMDEEFHINQTRTYCDGNYFTWNPKITTPPALYILALPLFCGFERYLNSALLPICFIGLCALRRKWHKKESNTLLTALNVVTLPVLFDTSVLFYTDLLSLSAVIWGFYFKNNSVAAALCFTVGTLTRQTNIVWAGMYCALLWIENLDLKACVRSTAKVLVRVWPFLILGAAFLAFVFLNKGIVLGDKTAHKPVLHAAQFLYFLGFTVFSSLPLFAWDVVKGDIWRDVRSKPIIVSFLIVLFSLIVQFGTLAHPYLLADNRHFPFYLWRKFFAKHWFCKFSLIPFYVISLCYVLRRIQNLPKLFSLFFVLSTCACIIPAYLIEFRYFIISFAIWRISVVVPSKTLLYLEIAWSFCINFCAMYLFLRKPFVWSHDPTLATQRFMW